MDIKHIDKSDSDYPVSLKRYLANDAPNSTTAMGNLEILNQHKLAIFCSAGCPAELISQTCDVVLTTLEPDVAVIGGFHSPAERECLSILLHRSQPVIVCPARSLTKLRIRMEYKEPLEKGRLLFLSFFRRHRHRSDVKMSVRRNRFVAALADRILIPFAAPDSKTERLCREIVGWKKPLITLASDLSENLTALGAKPLNFKEL